LQIILLHDLREGRPMMWAMPMREEQSAVATVDIAAQMKSILAQADESPSNR
jgi:hypothetical protein